MKKTNCLTDQDLLLYYYKELTTCSQGALHMADCASCKKRFAALNNDLAVLPEIPHRLDPVAGSRMAARVTEQLNRHHRRWIPKLGAAAVAGFALVLTVVIMAPNRELAQTAQVITPTLSAANVSEAMPDIDFLDDLELLKELELLSQIEGV